MKKLLALFLLLSGIATGALSDDALGLKLGSWTELTTGPGSDGTQALATYTALPGQSASGCMSVQSNAATVAIANLGYKISSVTGTPTNAYRISIQGVDSLGRPDGTVKGGASPASHTFTPSGSGWSWVTLDNAYTATRGDIICIVVERVVATDATSLTVAYRNVVGGLRAALPYSILYDGVSTWTKSSNIPLMAWANADYSVVGGFPNSAVSATTAAGGTAEAALIFTVPASLCSSFTVKGVEWQSATLPTGAHTFQATLYATPLGANTSRLQYTSQVDADVSGADTFSPNERTQLYFNDATLATLTCGTQYAIGLSASTTNDLAITTLQVASSTDLNAWPFRQNASLGTRAITYANPITTTTTFTNTTTSRPAINVIFGDITPPAAVAVGGVF